MRAAPSSRLLPLLLFALAAPALLSATEPRAAASPQQAGPSKPKTLPPTVIGSTPRPPPPHLSTAPEDPLDRLYRPAIALAPGREPRVTVRLMRGQHSVQLRAIGSKMTIRMRATAGGRPREAILPAGVSVEVLAKKAKPGAIRAFPVVADHHLDEAGASADSVKEWTGRGEAVRVVEVGSVFGLRGKIIDTRRTLLILEGPGDAKWVKQADARVAKILGRPPDHYETLLERPQARLEIRMVGGAPIGEADSLVSFSTASSEAELEIDAVEFGVGYRWHGRATRRFNGVVHVVAGEGGLQVVNELGLEDLLRGVVPAELYASAHPEALAAQAVTARGEVLAKIGTRHLAEPALLCAEQHCQVFKGESEGTQATDAAVLRTRGQVLLSANETLVDAVYSAVCGGHSENNEVVWGGFARPSLRGRLDFDAIGSWRRYAAGIGEAELRSWIDSSPPAWCNLSSFRNPSKFRWSRRIEIAEINQDLKGLGIGDILDLRVKGRGVSGRLKALEVRGTQGQTVIHRELPVRRLLGNLNSGAFVIERERDASGKMVAFVFKGAGWGHGVGMCQVGAIGMAEAGFDYKAILQHYFNGAHVAEIY